MFKIYIFLFILLLSSCSNITKTRTKITTSNLIKTVLDNYCTNYNLTNGDLIILSYRSIFEDSIKNKFFRNKPLDLIKKAIIDKNNLINKFSSIKIENSKVELLRYHQNNIFIDKKDFFKKLWKITLKKRLKKEYDFLGEITFYYKIYEFYVDENGKKIYMKESFDNELFKENNIKIRIERYLKWNKNLKINKNISIKEIIDKIVEELNIYPQKDSIKIIKPNNDNKLIVLIENKRLKSKIKILINQDNNKVIDMTYIAPKLYDLEPLINNNKHDSNFNCKSKGDK